MIFRSKCVWWMRIWFTHEVLAMIWCKIHVFTYSAFNVAFNTFWVISWQVVPWAEETSICSWSMFSTVHCWPSVSNFSHIGSGVTSGMWGECVTLHDHGPLKYISSVPDHTVTGFYVLKVKFIINWQVLKLFIFRITNPYDIISKARGIVELSRWVL